jgi:hypothetical protein
LGAGAFIGALIGIVVGGRVMGLGTDDKTAFFDPDVDSGWFESFELPHAASPTASAASAGTATPRRHFHSISAPLRILN